MLQIKLVLKRKKCYCLQKRAKVTTRWKVQIHRKVRDHSHCTGKYRGAAHSICNLRFNVPSKIPVVFRNGSNYDYHFIIKELDRNLRDNLNALEKMLKSTKRFLFQ